MENKKQTIHDAATLVAIFEHSQDGIITINSRGLIEAINPAAAELFGYLAEEVVGKNINMLMPSPYQSEHDGYLKNHRETGERKIIGIGREVAGKRKDGSVFPFFLSVSEVQLKDRKIFTGFIHDVSEIKKQEQEIRQLNLDLEKTVQTRTRELSETVNKLLTSNNQLEHEVTERKKVEVALIASEKKIRNALEKERELSVLKSRFVSMASHEFRTPLSTILSSTYLLGKYAHAGKTEKLDKHLHRIETAVTNLTNILNDFLSISKLEEGVIQANPKTFDLTELCREILDELEGVKKEAQQIIYTSELAAPEIWLDRKLLKNILINLLSNAIKYTPDGKNIFFTTHSTNQEIRIAIKDEGIGIPKKDQKELFGRFYRATNVTHIQGTGLGLNIVKKYLDLLSGEIEFVSKENVGSEFVVTIPFKEKND